MMIVNKNVLFADSQYRNSMNLALLNLQEGGVLREMKHKWWKEMHGGGACNVRFTLAISKYVLTKHINRCICRI